LHRSIRSGVGMAGASQSCGEVCTHLARPHAATSIPYLCLTCHTNHSYAVEQSVTRQEQSAAGGCCRATDLLLLPLPLLHKPFQTADRSLPHAVAVNAVALGLVPSCPPLLLFRPQEGKAARYPGDPDVCSGPVLLPPPCWSLVAAIAAGLDQLSEQTLLLLNSSKWCVWSTTCCH
jgi:hypothetical protein